MNQNKIRFGVVGTNFITDKIIAGGREDERFELTAVCSRSEDTLSSPDVLSRQSIHSKTL